MLPRCRVKEGSREGQVVLEVVSAEHAKLVAMANEQTAIAGPSSSVKRKSTGEWKLEGSELFLT